MSIVYKGLFKSEKVTIGSVINNAIRDYLIKNNWKYNNTTLCLEVIKQASEDHHYVYNLLESAERYDETGEEAKVLLDFLYRKIVIFANDFKKQPPTIAQQLRYEKACNKLGVKYEVQTTNKDIWLKTSELEALIAEQEGK